MLRRTFPYLFFISITAILAAVLNAHRKFAAAAFTPVMMNVCLIAAASLYAMQADSQGTVLGWGVFAAGLAQMGFLLFFARATCGSFRPQWGWRDSKVRRILTLMVPVVIGSSAAQVGVLLDTVLASFLASGSLSWLNFSQRLMEFPLGVFGVALATVALPRNCRGCTPPENATNTWRRPAGRSAPAWPYRCLAPPACSCWRNRSWPRCSWAANSDCRDVENGRAEPPGLRCGTARAWWESRRWFRRSSPGRT